MKEKCHLKLMKAIFIYFLFISFNSMAQEKNDNISKKTVQWYNGYDWLNESPISLLTKKNLQDNIMLTKLGGI